MSEEEYIEVEGCSAMAGDRVLMSVKLKNHFEDKGYWDDMSGELKYSCALLDMCKRQLERGEGKPMTYSYFIAEHANQTPEQSKALLSILPE